MKRSVRRRRLEARTDYKTRLELLKSGKPRIVIRKSNRYIIVQMVTSKIVQDHVLFGTSSKALLSKGWPEAKAGSLKSLPAAYLTGLLVGKHVKVKVREAILDIGMHRNIQKSRLYAVVRGLVDAGLSIPHDESVLPTDQELARHEALDDIFTKVKEKIEHG